jgi:D-alanyl-D-alanine carboxypeptidase
MSEIREQGSLFGGVSAMVLVALAVIGCWSPTESPNRESTPTPKPTSTVAANDNTNKMTNQNSQNKPTATGFTANLPEGFRTPTDDAGRLLLKEYGAVFMARGGVTPPKTVVFKDQAEVTAFQSSLKTSSESIGGFNLELQAAAMDGLRKAIADAKAAGLSISPRDKDSAKRSYDETIELWASRVDPGLKHWVSKGKMTQAQADKLKSLSPYEQVPEVLKLEQQGIFFAKDLSKSIIYSVAPPGTSQHLSMLAMDIKEHEDSKVRDILAKNGWYQTVISDLPHFTYLGVPDSELSKLGLRKTTGGGRTFWTPEV